MSAPEQALPRPSLSVVDGVALLVGVVIGIGIFKTPQLVAANVDSAAAFIALWVAGGAITLVGALVYAELGAAYPNAGGEYHFLSRAFGSGVGLIFAWARVAVIQTGAIAAVAFVFGDYAQQLVALGKWGSSIYAALAIVIFTAINLFGTRQSKGAQVAFTVLTVVALLAVVAVALLANDAAPGAAVPPSPSNGAIGLAMVFILLTYGGWNEAAYLSSDLRDVRRNMVRVLVIGTGVVLLVYILVNIAYLKVLGLEGLRQSDAVAADAMRLVMGDTGASVVSLIVCGAALTTLNGTIFTGARLYYAIGRDMPALRMLGVWNVQGNTPTRAIVLQSAIAIALLALGTATRGGFQAMVEYTAPVFWFFLLLVGVAFFVLRWREPDHVRPYRAPLYPITPVIYCLTCGYLLYSSIVYTGFGALVGVAVLILGVPFLILARSGTSAAPEERPVGPAFGRQPPGP